MSKRKLSRQQAWRVEKIQDERAKRAARRTEAAENALTGGELGPEREGLVIAHYGTQVAVESEPGVSQRCHIRANIEGLVTGDRVVWCEGEPTGVVVAQLDRQSVLSRPDPYGKLKADQILATKADYCITPCHNCHAQIHDMSELNDHAWETLHLWTLICLSLGILGPNERGYLGDDLKEVLPFHPESEM